MGPDQETDAWWGSYSGWTMIPSTVVCFALTAFIAWASWRLLEREWVKVSVLTLAGAVWLVQAFRWCYRVFGYTYRVTTRRLFLIKGLPDPVEVNLAEVARVEVERGRYHILADIGNVVLTLADASRVVLEGVTHLRQVADHLGTLCEQARERPIASANG